MDGYRTAGNAQFAVENWIKKGVNMTHLKPDRKWCDRCDEPHYAYIGNDLLKRVEERIGIVEHAHLFRALALWGIDVDSFVDFIRTIIDERLEERERGLR